MKSFSLSCFYWKRDVFCRRGAFLSSRVCLSLFSYHKQKYSSTVSHIHANAYLSPGEVLTLRCGGAVNCSETVLRSRSVRGDNADGGADAIIDDGDDEYDDHSQM